MTTSRQKSLWRATKGRSCSALTCALWLFLFLQLFLQIASPGLAAEVTLIPGPTEAAQIRIDLGTRATSELLVTSYVFAQDESGLASLAIMKEAAERGVEVFLVVDDFAAGKKPSMAAIKAMQEAGVQVRIFNKLKIRFDFLANLDRTHEKLILRDRLEYITGGRNIDNAYFGINVPAWQDMDIYVNDRASAKVARDSFFVLFDSAEEVDTSRVTAAQVAELQRRMALSMTQLESRFQRDSGIDWAKRGVVVGNVDFIADNPKTKGNETTEAVLQFIRAAKHTLDIETAYLVPTGEVKAALRDAVARGVQVRILTNSSASNNQWLVAANLEYGVKELVSLGAEIYLHRGATLHSKYMTADNARTAIMTYNLNHRSVFYDLELAVIIESSELAQQTRLEFEKRLLVGRFVGKEMSFLPEPACFSLSSRYFSRLLTKHL